MFLCFERDFLTCLLLFFRKSEFSVGKALAETSSDNLFPTMHIRKECPLLKPKLSFRQSASGQPFHGYAREVLLRGLAVFFFLSFLLAQVKPC